MTTPRSLSISAGSNETLCAQSSRIRNALLEDLRLVGRHLQHVDRLVEARVRVQARPEPHADRLHERHDLLLREVLRAVERHVLDEVRQARLVVVFEDRAGVDDEPELGALLRLLVGPDVVLEAVLEGSDRDLRIGRDGRAERQRWARVPAPGRQPA